MNRSKKIRKLKRYKKGPGFVALSWDVLNSKAFQKMTASSRALLPYFLGKPKRHFKDSEYCDAEFTFTGGEAKRYGFSKGTFSRSKDQIISHGFVDPVVKGGLRGHAKTASKFRLSRRWEDFGTEDFVQIEWETFIPDRSI